MDYQKEQDSTNVRKKLTTGQKVGAIILLVSFWVTVILIIWSYNSCIRSRNAIISQRAQLENTIASKADLIESLTKNAKNYAADSNAITEELNKALENLQTAISSDDTQTILEANKEVDEKLSKLIDSLDKQTDYLYEIYDDIASELGTYQGMVRQEARKLNKKIEAYNNTIQTWPGCLYARLFGIEKEETFSIENYFTHNLR